MIAQAMSGISRRAHSVWRRSVDLRHNQSGSVVIEYAFILPVLFLLIFGTLEFALVLHLRGSIEEATRQTARMSITGSVYGADTDRSTMLLARLQDQIGNIVFDEDKVSIFTETYDTYVNFNADAGTGVGSVTTNPNAYGNANQIIRYTVTYEHEFLTPIAYMANGMEESLIITSTVFAKNEDF